MAVEDDGPPPPPRRRPPTVPFEYETPPPAHLSEKTRVSIEAWKVVVGAISLVTASITGYRAYDGIQQSIGRLDVKIADVGGRLAQFDPAKVRDTCREMVLEQMKSTVFECPKRIVKGEAALCKPVISRNEQ